MVVEKKLWNLKPQRDLCVRHSPLLGPLLYGNVYDDCNFPASKPGTYFKADMLIIPAQIAVQVLPVHTEHLAKNMNQI